MATKLDLTNLIIGDEVLSETSMTTLNIFGDQMETGWVGKMQLRQEIPFQGWSQRQWDAYCARGAYFLEDPHYELAEHCEFTKMEQRAIRHGWKLLARTTNHNGVCPAHLGSIGWMQETRWNFVVPGYGLMLQIRYTELGQNTIDISSFIELQCIADCSGWSGRESFGDWCIGRGCYSDQCSFTLEFTSKSKSKRSVDLCFPDVFWTEWDEVLPTVKKGRLSKLPSSWAGACGMPGFQTKPRQILAYEFELKYLQKLGQTETPDHVECFSLSNSVQVTIDRRWAETYGGDINTQLIAYVHLTPQTQIMVDCVWQYVRTGKPDPNGKHDTCVSIKRHHLRESELNLSHNQIGAEGVQVFATALLHNRSLTQLDLEDNMIGAEGAQALATALRSNQHLTQLNLSHNQIGSVGARVLAFALLHNRSLTQLDLEDNMIGAEGARALATALQSNQCLTQLNLSHNQIGAEGGTSARDRSTK